jgi:hypothetical protein
MQHSESSNFKEANGRTITRSAHQIVVGLVIMGTRLSTQSSTCRPAGKLQAAVGHLTAGISANPSDYLQKW